MLHKPGDNDPAIPEVLFSAIVHTAIELPATDIIRQFQAYSVSIYARSTEMKLDGSLKWWFPPSASRSLSEMSYECDARLLEVPSIVDCTQIEWQGLGPVSDTLHRLAQIRPRSFPRVSNRRYL